jgi:hypothetical protein
MPKAGLPTNFCAEPRTGADGPHDRLLSGAGIGGVWPAAHRGRSVAPKHRRGTCGPILEFRALCQ